MAKEKVSSFICYGVNSAISIINSNRFNIRYIDIMKNGNAQKNKKLLNVIDDSIVTVLEKKDFLNKYPVKKTQGIAVNFYGQTINSFFPDFSTKSNICLLALDRIEDPQNFGQIIRTAECAGIDGILFSKHYSAPINNTVLQVSQGAFVNIPIYEITNLNQLFLKLKKNGFWIIGIENSVDAKQWHEINYRDKTVIVVGSEGYGIRKKILENCDFVSTIPMQGKSSSLNVSATVSAILFERLRQIQ